MNWTCFRCVHLELSMKFHKNSCGHTYSHMRIHIHFFSSIYFHLYPDYKGCVHSVRNKTICALHEQSQMSKVVQMSKDLKQWNLQKVSWSISSNEWNGESDWLIDIPWRERDIIHRIHFMSQIIHSALIATDINLTLPDETSFIMCSHYATHFSVFWKNAVDIDSDTPFLWLFS